MWDDSLLEGAGLSITIECDVYDIPKFIKELNHKKAQIDRAIDLGIEDAAVKIESKLFDLMSKYGVDLSQYVNVTMWNRGFEVSVDGKLPMFVEYGTGIVGSWNPHPEDPWEYDVNNHGYGGWIYQGADNKLHWTRGMPSRPYFYDLEQWVKHYGIVKRCINKRLRAIK